MINVREICISTNSERKISKYSRFLDETEVDENGHGGHWGKLYPIKWKVSYLL